MVRHPKAATQSFPSKFNKDIPTSRIPDLDRPKHHPKRSFITRALELEIRLAYHERIMKTLPEPFLDPEVGCLSDVAPGPDFEFESPREFFYLFTCGRNLNTLILISMRSVEHPYHEPTQALLDLIRTRAPVDKVIPVAESLRSNISDNVTLSADTTPESAVRTITMQILLHVGSRSISHFLNAIERYLPLLRTLGSTPENKIDFLNASAKFWRRNGQMVSIVFDKLMQYQIVDPSDIISWSFRGVNGEDATPSIDVQSWDLLKAALDKAIGRVAIAHQKVQTLRKDDEDAKAKAMAVVTSDEMEVDSQDAKKGDSEPTCVRRFGILRVRLYSQISERPSGGSLRSSLGRRKRPERLGTRTANGFGQST